MQEMTYIDLHCDTLTACADRGLRLGDCGLQTDLAKLKKSRCAAQCFALFTQGERAAEDYDRYQAAVYRETMNGGLELITNAKDLKKRIYGGGPTGGILTVENLGFIGDCADKIADIYGSGVRMASLVWNYENGLAYPNLVSDGGAPFFDRRESRGLKDAGRRAVEAMDALGIIVDLSHLSDGGAGEILKGRKIPAVASHSNAASVCGVSRNLTDELIAGIAGCGGVVGVNFCKDFIGNCDIFGGLCAHIKHIISVGGEEVVALGSDFDGIPPYAELADCTRVPSLFKYLYDHGISAGVLEKLAYKNSLRVFEEVVG